MVKLIVRKNTHHSLSGKAKENHCLSPAQVATSQPWPKPRPTGKQAKVAQVLTNTSNTNQEAQGAAETLVLLHTCVVPEAPIHWYCPALFNIAPGTPLITSSELDSDEIDLLNSDNEIKISSGMSQSLDCIQLHL